MTVRIPRASARAAAGLAALLATTVLLAGCGTESEPGDAANDTETSSAPTSAAPTEETSSDPATPSTPASSDSAAAPVAMPAYFVGDTPRGKRLFREFRSVPADNPVDEVLALVAAGDALDPDYSTLLSGTGWSLRSYDENAVISVPDASFAERPAGMSAKDAKLAIQQVVHTVQGALQKKIPVVFYAGDQPVDLFGVRTPATTQGYQAGKFYNVLALVNVTEPVEAATVSGTFAASGVASSFEGTVPWEVRDQSGKAVLTGSAQADGYVDDLYPWQTQVDVSSLPPGTYTFAVMTDDPSGGEGGAGPTEDTKTITVG